MVVLEGGGMLSTSGNQYLPPDYLSPLPTTLDAKKSPLALLAQTCSQIGADSPSSKPLISSLEKTKKTSNSDTRLSPGSARDKNEKTPQRNTPSNETKLAFKPYESNVITKKSDDNNRPTSKPNNSQNFTNNNNNNNNDERKSESSSQQGDRKSASPSHSNPSATPSSETGKASPANSERKSTPSARGASPIIRSGLEILQGHPKDTPLGTYKPGLSSLQNGLSGPLSSLCCPPGLEHTNPAFRPPFPGAAAAAFSHHHAAMLAAGYPGAAPGPYLSYARVKTPSGGEALVPVCKDPYCTGCQFSLQNQQLLMSGAAAGPCPSGCTQCDHQKYNLAMAMSLGAVPPSSLAYSQLGRPYVCNWIAGDTYCGKRFVTSEELLQHLRTHTSGSDAASVVTSSASSLLSPHSLFSSAALHRSGYPNPPLSPLSARYHPYGKPPLQTPLAASPYSAFNPTLGPYYSPYSMYGQRIGAAAVHP